MKGQITFARLWETARGVQLWPPGGRARENYRAPASALLGLLPRGGVAMAFALAAAVWPFSSPSATR